MDSGETLGVDLYNLWLCATSDLPAMAERAVIANRILATHVNDQSLFNRKHYSMGYQPGGGTITSNSTGRVYPYFDQIRDDLQNILAESVANIYDCSEVLLKILKEYQESDQESAQQFVMEYNEGKGNPDIKIYDVTNRPTTTRAQ